MSNTNIFGGEFSVIRGNIGGYLSQVRLPMLGKIRLGKVIRKAKTDKCKHNDNEYCYYCSRPSDVPYFIVPDEVKKVYGNEPTELDVIFPINDIPLVFPQALKLYGTTGLKCIGNGETCKRKDVEQKKWVVDVCPCENLKTPEMPKGQCFKRASLFVILYKVNMGGCYRVVSSSYNTIIDVRSGLIYTEGLVGRFARVPLILKRTPMETTYITTEGKSIKSTHYPLSITSNLTIEEVQQLAAETSRLLPEISPERIALPIPKEDEDNPLQDREAVITDVVDDELPDDEVIEPKQLGNQMVSPKPINNYERITPPQTAKMHAICDAMKIDKNNWHKLLQSRFGKMSSKDLTKGQASELIDDLMRFEASDCEWAISSDGKPYFDYSKAKGI